MDVEARLLREREADVPDLPTIIELRDRHKRLLAGARKGWHTDPGNDDTRPPAAAAARAP